MLLAGWNIVGYQVPFLVHYRKVFFEVYVTYGIDLVDHVFVCSGPLYQSLSEKISLYYLWKHVPKHVEFAAFLNYLYIRWLRYLSAFSSSGGRLRIHIQILSRTVPRSRYPRIWILLELGRPLWRTRNKLIAIFLIKKDKYFMNTDLQHW